MINTRCSFSNLNKSVIRMSFFAVVWGDLMNQKKSDMGNTFDQESEFKENSDIFQTYRKRIIFNALCVWKWRLYMILTNINLLCLNICPFSLIYNSKTLSKIFILHICKHHYLTRETSCVMLNFWNFLEELFPLRWDICK